MSSLVLEVGVLERGLETRIAHLVVRAFGDGQWWPCAGLYTTIQTCFDVLLYMLIKCQHSDECEYGLWSQWG